MDWLETDTNVFLVAPSIYEFVHREVATTLTSLDMLDQPPLNDEIEEAKRWDAIVSDMLRKVIEKYIVEKKHELLPTTAIEAGMKQMLLDRSLLRKVSAQ